jgi:hypothetical protein
MSFYSLCYSSDISKSQIKDEMGGTRNTYKGEVICMQILGGEARRKETAWKNKE